MMTRDEVVERMRVLDDAIAKVDSAIQQSVQNLNVLKGGKMECSRFLSEIDAKEAASNEVANDDFCCAPESAPEEVAQ